ncbi:galactosyl transferase gma12 mnn10 family protein [Phlyctema vagabunda]|uniref:Galactosyl transferase gma12 mnn10 family protein n=1 Tax=Phlyctema vagabunda TaxID=108571 RepID=A0ABR4P9R5_9HELO
MKPIYLKSEDEILAREQTSPLRSRSFHQTPFYYETHRMFKKKTTKLVLCLLVGLAVFELLRLNASVMQSARTPTTKAHTTMSSEKSISKGLVGKVHACFGDCNPTYERALNTHLEHSEKMGHPMFVLREKILNGLWSKPAYILGLILAELSLPEEERLQWLLWNDADIVIMNPNIPLDIFIPPSPEFDNVNLLVTNDRHGLNNGVFLIRVNDWSVKLLSGIISYHFFRPQVELKYTEQSGMEEMIQDPYWKKSVVYVPQFWFNSYPVSVHREHKKDIRIYEYRPGALQIHFASNRDGKRPERMNSYMDKAEKAGDANAAYAPPLSESWYPGNITAFWDELRAKRAKEGPISETDGAATNYFPVKNEDGSYIKVDTLSEKETKEPGTQDKLGEKPSKESESPETETEVHEPTHETTQETGNGLAGDLGQS